MKANQNTGTLRDGLDHLHPTPSANRNRIDTLIDTDANCDELTEIGTLAGHPKRLSHAPTNETPIRALDHGGVPALRGPSATMPKADPPLLIGGLLQQNPNKDIYINLTGGGIDYLTVTVPPNTAEIMVQKSEHDEPGNAGRGFRQSEKRMCMGGYCWRRWEPITSSKRWGTEYETWEFSGVTALDPSRYLLDHESKPSRIDLAFDYDVDPDFYPIALESLIEDHVESRSTKIRYVGERGKQTLYIGSQKSDRMIRIYRRDEKNPLLAAEGRSILRVELVLKKDLAVALWARMRETGTNGLPEAAGHVLEMIGYAPTHQVGDIPPLLRTDEDTEAVQMLMQFVTQNSVMLKAISVCDIDLEEIVDAKIESTKHRMQESRLTQKIQALALVDPVRLKDQVIALIGR